MEGVPVVGYELNATKLEPSGASVDYQWQSITEENGEYTDIDGATNETYTVTEGDLWVRVKVTAKSGSNYRGTKYSTPVEIVDYFVTPKTGSAIKGNETITVYAPGADDLRIMLWAKKLETVQEAKEAYDDKVFSSRTQDLVNGGMVIENGNGTGSLSLMPLNLSDVVLRNITNLFGITHFQINSQPFNLNNQDAHGTVPLDAMSATFSIQ